MKLGKRRCWEKVRGSRVQIKKSLYINLSSMWKGIKYCLTPVPNALKKVELVDVFSEFPKINPLKHVFWISIGLLIFNWNHNFKIPAIHIHYQANTYTVKVINKNTEKVQNIFGVNSKDTRWRRMELFPKIVNDWK